MSLSSDNVKSFLMLAVAGIVVYEVHKAYKATGQLVSSAEQVASTTLNPASDQNFVYQGTQQAGHSLGAWLYKVTH